MNLFKKRNKRERERNRFTDIENKSVVAKGERWDKFGI